MTAQNAQKPRVLLFVPEYPFPIKGGMERQAHELAKALTANNHVAVTALSGKVVPEHPGQEIVEGISVTRMPWTWSDQKLLRLMRAAWSIPLYMWRARRGFDILHVHEANLISLYAIFVGRVLGKPVLTKLPNVGERGIPGLLNKPLGRLGLKVILSSKGIVAMSPASVAELTSVDFPETRILQVPNGIARLGQDKPLGKKTGPCRVVFVGRLVSQKRLDVLLQAWAEVTSQLGDQAQLEIWGSGPKEDELKALADRLGLAQTVTFAGQVTDVRKRLSACDVFVLASEIEGNSNAILEAMDAGLPVVATRVGGAMLQLGPEGAAFTVDVGDPQALAASLKRLIEDQNLRRDLGAAMARRVDAHFDIAGIAKTYAQAYQLIANGAETHLSSVNQLPEEPAIAASPTTT